MGTMYGCIVGGVSNRWEFLLIGRALSEMADAEGKADAADMTRTVVASAKIWKKVADKFIGSSIGEGLVLFVL